MLMLISPAKTLDFKTAPTTNTFSLPDYLKQSQVLIDQLKTMSPQDISELMKVSDSIAGLNVARFAEWDADFTLKNAKQAILAFKGDVYSGLNADDFSEQDFAFAQNHLRILSGLYGLLRPLDLMQPYRLEMGTKLKNKSGKNLYEFWGDHLNDGLNQLISQEKHQYVLNLASKEYFSAINPKQLKVPVINVDFKDCKNGQYKIISFYAKKARGLMARYVIQNQIDQPKQLKHFSTDGYYYAEDQSKPDHLIFLRKE